MKKWRKALAMLLAAVMTVSLVPETRILAAGSAEGYGVLGSYRLPDADLIITSAAQMKAFADSVANNSYEGKTVCLGADIAFPEDQKNNYEPVWGTFKGTFDGAGHTISGINVELAGANVGLFENLSGLGTIKNLTLKDCTFKTSGSGSTGSIVAFNHGSLLNLAVVGGTVANTGRSETAYTGGITGYSDHEIYNCRNIGTAVKNNSYAGGVVGYSVAEIINCFSSGTVESIDFATGYTGQGGVAGYSKANIINSANAGSIIQKFGSFGYVGGIVGNAEGCSLSNCYNAGVITCEGSNHYTGSLIGFTKNSITVKNCYYGQATCENVYGYDNKLIVGSGNQAMLDADMQKSTFVTRLNTNSEATNKWLRWTFGEGCVYPQHVKVYAVNKAEGSYGTVTLSCDYAGEGSKVDFTVTPNKDYKVKSVSVTTEAGQSVKVTKLDSKYTFTMPAETVTVSASYAFSKQISECDIVYGIGNYTYDGTAKKPAVSIRDGLSDLVQGTDYRLAYYSYISAGTARVVITGIGNYAGKVTKTYTIKKAVQKLSVPALSYTVAADSVPINIGATCEAGPKRIVYSSSNKSVVSVNSSGKMTIKAPGRATITVKAPGNKNYAEESKTIEILVNPKRPTAVKLTTLNGLKLNITWPKDTAANGYEIQFSKDKTNWSTRVKNGADNNTLTLEKLTEGKCYYVRVRSFKNQGEDKIYSSYSEIQQSAKIENYVTPQVGNCVITLSNTSYTYNGQERVPEVSVVYNEQLLTKDVDYTLVYSNNKNAGTAEVKITGKGRFTGEIIKYFTINKVVQKITAPESLQKVYGDKDFALGAKLVEGAAKLRYKSSNTRVVSVGSDGKVKVKGPGYAVITVTAGGNANYTTATATVAITVSPKKMAIKKLEALDSSRIRVHWEKDNSVKGYVIEYSTSSDFANAQKIIINGFRREAKDLTGLLPHTTYYVRMCGYKIMKVNGKAQTFYGAYSKAKKIQTK